MNKHFLSKIGFLLLLIIIISICAVSKTTTYESFTEIRLETLMNQFKEQNNKYEEIINKLSKTQEIINLT